MNKMMNNDELQEIRARAEAATPGPWNSARLGNAWGVDVHTADGTYQRNIIKASIGQNNAQFIAHARADIPALLEHIEHQRRALEWIAAHIAVVCNDSYDCPLDACSILGDCDAITPAHWIATAFKAVEVPVIKLRIDEGGSEDVKENA